MRAAALEIGDPENDGVNNGETCAAGYDFRQHVLHQQILETHDAPSLSEWNKTIGTDVPLEMDDW